MLQINACEICVEDVLFSDETYFCLDSFVSNQSCYIWKTENIHVAVPSSSKVMAWVTIISKGLIGLFFRLQRITVAILYNCVEIQNALEVCINSQLYSAGLL